MPVTQVPPFDVGTEYPREVAGVAMSTYLDWMESCWCITVTGLPAISVPCGFTADGLPVGVQIVGRRHDDLGVLRLAHAFEAATQVGRRRPDADRLTPRLTRPPRGGSPRPPPDPPGRTGRRGHRP